MGSLPLATRCILNRKGQSYVTRNWGCKHEVRSQQQGLPLEAAIHAGDFGLWILVKHARFGASASPQAMASPV